jgi:Flp pilus assembly pilin Flp
MSFIRRFVTEDTGAETVEYALVLGLMAIAAVAGITLAGKNVLAWWNSLAAYIATVPA